MSHLEWSNYFPVAKPQNWKRLYIMVDLWSPCFEILIYYMRLLVSVLRPHFFYLTINLGTSSNDNIIVEHYKCCYCFDFKPQILLYRMDTGPIFFVLSCNSVPLQRISLIIDFWKNCKQFEDRRGAIKPPGYPLKDANGFYNKVVMFCAAFKRPAVFDAPLCFISQLFCKGLSLLLLWSFITDNGY